MADKIDSLVSAETLLLIAVFDSLLGENIVINFILALFIYLSMIHRVNMQCMSTHFCACDPLSAEVENRTYTMIDPADQLMFTMFK